MENKKRDLIFICERKIIHFFEDYIHTFHHIFNVEILLFNNNNQTKNYLDSFAFTDSHINDSYHKLNNSVFVFMQFIPHEIIENIQFYINH